MSRNYSRIVPVALVACLSIFALVGKDSSKRQTSRKKETTVTTMEQPQNGSIEKRVYRKQEKTKTTQEKKNKRNRFTKEKENSIKEEKDKKEKQKRNKRSKKNIQQTV